MTRTYFALLALLYATLTQAQDDFDANRDLNPDAAWYESPTLWILLAIGLVAGLLYLRKQTRRPGRN